MDKLTGLTLDSAIKAIAKFLIDLEEIFAINNLIPPNLHDEIRKINARHKLVKYENEDALINDVIYMYQFERNRQLKNIDRNSYAGFINDKTNSDYKIKCLISSLDKELSGVIVSTDSTFAYKIFLNDQ